MQRQVWQLFTPCDFLLPPSSPPKRVMTDPAAPSVAFGFKRTAKTTNVGINVLDEGPTKVALSAVERGGVFRTVDGQDAAAVIQPPKSQKVIPMQANTYKAGGGKFAPSFVPPASDAPVGGQTGEDKFEMAAPAVATSSEPQTYGLQRVKRKAEGAAEEGGGERAGLGGSITERLTAAKEEQAYQQQVEELPEMATIEVRGIREYNNG